jgi:hypothetical protein
MLLIRSSSLHRPPSPTCPFAAPFGLACTRNLAYMYLQPSTPPVRVRDTPRPTATATARPSQVPRSPPVNPLSFAPALEGDSSLGPRFVPAGLWIVVHLHSQHSATNTQHPAHEDALPSVLLPMTCERRRNRTAWLARPSGLAVQVHTPRGSRLVFDRAGNTLTLRATPMKMRQGKLYAEMRHALDPPLASWLSTQVLSQGSAAGTSRRGVPLVSDVVTPSCLDIVT